MKSFDPYDLLRRIGEGLDRQIFPVVQGGGVVMPSDSTGSINLGEEYEHACGARGPATGSWEGAPGGKGTSRGSWSAGARASVVFDESAAPYQQQLNELCDTYAGSQVTFSKGGCWLLVPTKVLEGLQREALILVALPFDMKYTVQSWAFWREGKRVTWIGPRHTNFPEGSICAFDPRDDTWAPGGSLVTLLDIYSVWVLRQLFLEQFGRWPGSQVARWAAERLIETRPGELCGCGSRDKLYEQCCRQSDSQNDWQIIFGKFLREAGARMRAPPPDLFAAVSAGKLLPNVDNYTLPVSYGKT